MTTTRLCATLKAGAALLALTLAAPSWAQDGAADRAQARQTVRNDAQVIALNSWDYDELYRSGWSARRMIDADVYGQNGEEIGEVENILVGTDGTIRSLIIEAGGFLDIGDTEFAVPWDRIPWDRVTADAGSTRVTVPLNEDNIDQFDVFGEHGYDMPAAGGVREVREGDDMVTPRTWRVTELLDDTVRLKDGGGYGYVRDLIFDPDGTLKSVVVTTDAVYGTRNSYAYPYYGYEYGFNPGLDYYGLPYGTNDLAGLEPFDYTRLPAGELGLVGEGSQ